VIGADIKRSVVGIDVKNVFLRFLFWSRFFTFLNVFSKRFFILKNVGNVQSGKQINKKHFIQ